MAGYNIYRNGIRLNTSPVTTLSYTDATVSSGSTYTYTIKTVDVAGNLSTSSVGILVSSAPSSTSGSFEVLTPLP